jgi:hypothetical protein
MDPIRLRLMTDDVSGIAIWGELFGPSESQLPIPAELRGRVRAWVDDYTDSIMGAWTDDWSVDHDRRGYALSLELEAALGPDYDLVYRPETSVVRAEIEAAGGKTEHWSRRPHVEPRPGGRWVAHRPGSQPEARPRPGTPDDQA